MNVSVINTLKLNTSSKFPKLLNVRELVIGI